MAVYIILKPAYLYLQYLTNQEHIVIIFLIIKPILSHFMQIVRIITYNLFQLNFIILLSEKKCVLSLVVKMVKKLNVLQ